MTTKIKSGVIAAGAVDASALSDNSITIAHLNCSDGTNGQVLTTDGSGTLSFSTISGYTDSDVETYLNTSEIYTDATNNRLGIGAASPDSKLHIDGNFDGPLVTIHNTGGATSAYAGLEVETSTTGSYVQRWLNAGTELMRVTGDGKVGIGDVPSSNATGSMSPRLFVDNNLGDGTLGLQIASYHPSIVLSDKSSGLHNYIISHDGGHFSIGYEGGTAGSSNSFTSRLKILSSGNVGIGTTSPDMQLEVAGPSGSSSTFKLSGRPDWTSGNGQYNVGNIYGENLGAGVNTTRIKLDGDDTSGSMRFYTANSGTLTSAMYIDNSQNVVFGSTANYSRFDSDGNLVIEHGGAIGFEAASNDYSTQYSAIGYTSLGYSTSSRYWNHLISKGGTHITVNSDATHTASENPQDDFVVWQGDQDAGEPLFRVSNTGRVIAKQNYEIGNHKTNKEEFGVNAINTVDTATSDINTTVTNTYENRPGVYWLNFNSKRFRAFIKPNWLQSRNWVLAAKFFSHMDMPSGSSLWTNDTSWNGGDFDLNNGHFSKYGKVWRYFGFDRLAMQMGDRIAPIMQFSSTQTLYGAFSGGIAANGGGVTASSTDPQIANSARYHNMTNYIGPAFTDLGGSEDIMQSYGLNKWANSSTNGTSANNQGSRSVTAGGKGFELTVEDAHPNIGGNDSVGVAGAWIGCPMDEGSYTFGGAGSNAGADSGFGFGGGCGNNARTWTSGVGEWARGNEVANYLPAYIWLSID